MMCRGGKKDLCFLWVTGNRKKTKVRNKHFNNHAMQKQCTTTQTRTVTCTEVSKHFMDKIQFYKNHMNHSGSL